MDPSFLFASIGAASALSFAAFLLALAALLRG